MPETTVKKTAKRTFTVTINGKEWTLAVTKPTAKQLQKAELFKAAQFRQAVEGGAIIRDRMESVLLEQKLWDEKKQARYVELTKRLNENELKLAKGKMKLSEAKNLALQMAADRDEYGKLRSVYYSLDDRTAEGIATNAHFNYLVATCTVYDDGGQAYYRDYDDYLSREDDPVAPLAAKEMSKFYYGIDDKDPREDQAEWKFLKKYKLCDDKFRLVNAQGQLVDARGRRVDEEGWLVNDQGQRIDADGNLLTADGDYASDGEPVFYDDDGNVISLDGPAATPEVAHLMPADAETV